MAFNDQVALVKNSFSDYPGQIACAIFLKGCNLRCPYCQNKNLALNLEDDSLLAWDEVLEFLYKRRGLLKAVVISGGEAALHPDIQDLISEITALDYKIKLDINGSLPLKIEPLIDKVDYIAMDIKLPAHMALTGFGRQEQEASLKLLNQSAVDFELRSVVSPDFCNYEDLSAYFDLVRSSRYQLWRLLPFRPGHCLDSRFDELEACPHDYAASLKTRLTDEGFNVIL